MENPFKYIGMLSLEDMAVVQIAAAMWKHTDVKDSVMEILRSESYLRNDNRNLFYSVANKATEKVDQLKIPEVLQEKIKHSIRCIGREILKCVNFYYKISLNQSNIDLLSQFCFTPHGTIDKKKTAEMIVKDENLDINIRYKWACVYCLKDDIWELWNKMSKYCKLSILNECYRNVLHQEEGNRKEVGNPEKYVEDLNLDESDEEEVNLKDCDDGVNLKDCDDGVNLKDCDDGVNLKDCDDGVNLKDCDDGVNKEDYNNERFNPKDYNEEGVFQEEGLLCEAFLENDYADELEHRLEQFLNECYSVSEYLQHMVCLWTLAAKKKQLEYTLSFPYLFKLFHCSVRLNNTAAIAYFLPGLDDQYTIERFFIFAAERSEIDPDPDFFIFLLSKMTEEQQLRVFKGMPCKILSFFLHWPFQNYFLETVGRMWDFLSPQSYKNLLIIIITYSIELFGEFWQKSPTELKQYITNDSYILILLIQIKDEKNSVLIFQYMATVVEEKELTNRVRNICKLLLTINKWSSLKLFIRKCLLENSSKDEMSKFKEDMENYILSTDLKEKILTNRQTWDEIFKESNCEEDSSK